MSHSGATLAELLDQLRRVLEEERSILLSGSPHQIAAVVERKMALAEMIERMCQMPGAPAPSRESVLWLDRYNRGNSVICSAMLRHLVQTLDRLRSRELHRSYGPDGAESSPNTPSALGAA